MVRWVFNRFGGGGPRYGANPGLTPGFRRSLPETGCLSQGLPRGICCPFVMQIRKKCQDESVRTSYSGHVKPATRESYQEQMARVVPHIEGHLEEPLPLEELAAVACFSPYHFHRVFRGTVGESVKEHVRRLRLERAARRLLSGDSTVLELALDAGYETPRSEEHTSELQSL